MYGSNDGVCSERLLSRYRRRSSVDRRPKGKDYTELLDDMINFGIKDYKRRISKTRSFKSNILQGFANGMKGMKGKLK